MTAREIIEILEKDPDFKVRVTVSTGKQDSFGMDILETHEITELNDIGYSDGVINFHCEYID